MRQHINKKISFLRQIQPAYIGLLTVPFILSGCALLPKEEEVQNAPVIQTEEAVDYETDVVTRQDMVVTEVINTKYTQTVEAAYDFKTSGVIEKLYVSVGDEVKKGDLLLKLDAGDAENLLAEEKEERAACQSEYDYYSGLKTCDEQDLAIKRDYGELTEEEYQRELTSLDNQYIDQLSTLTDRLTILDLKISNQEETVSHYYIYADIDGMVYYTVNVIDLTNQSDSFINNGWWNRVNYVQEGDIGVKVFDNTKCVFSGITSHPEAFSVGDMAVLTDKAGNTYDTEISQVSIEGIQFALLEPDPSLSVNASAIYTLLLDQREDVLTVNTKAIHKKDDETFVYYMQDNGIRSTKPVVCGEAANGRTEVISGLMENDIVIVR